MVQNSDNPSLITISTVDKTKADSSPYTLTYRRLMAVTDALQGANTVFGDGANDKLTI